MGAGGRPGVGVWLLEQTVGRAAQTELASEVPVATRAFGRKDG
jgi:hypothetical protein